MYVASGRRTYSGTARKEEKNGERETRLTQGGFWLIGQTYKFVATYPWITWGPRHTRWSPNFGTTTPGECHAQRDTSPVLSSTSAWSFLLNGWPDTSYARVRDAPCPTASSLFLSSFFSHLFVYLPPCSPRVLDDVCTWILLSSGDRYLVDCFRDFIQVMLEICRVTFRRIVSLVNCRVTEWYVYI